MTIFERKIKCAGLSIYSIAKATGVPVMTLWYWTKGRHLPNRWGNTYNVVLAYCRTAGVELEPCDFASGKEVCNG